MTMIRKALLNINKKKNDLKEKVGISKSWKTQRPKENIEKNTNFKIIARYHFLILTLASITI